MILIIIKWDWYHWATPAPRFHWTFPKGMSSVKQSIPKLLPTFAHKLIYWWPISWRASWCYNMADTRTVLFSLCWHIFCVKLQKHLLLCHAWLENIDYVGLKYMSNFDQSYCYNHFNMSFTRPSVGYARLAEKFVNHSPIYVQWEIFHPALLMMSFQWQIQDFPWGGMDLMGGHGLWGSYVSWNLYVKMTELGPLGGTCTGCTPLNPPMHSVIDL